MSAPVAWMITYDVKGEAVAQAIVGGRLDAERARRNIEMYVVNSANVKIRPLVYATEPLMKVDNDWLREGIESDPDLESEVRSA